MAASLEQRTVLVVGDDPLITDLLKTVLEDQGYRVVTALGCDAIALAHDRRPDVILLDITVPEMDGVAVSRLLHADSVTADIPLIALSAQEELSATGRLITAREWLAKPFELGALYEAVARWVEPHGAVV